ncbi:MAG: hypothetical protein IH865_10835 [Chloroflexi bacterium]|nr:hypothetical protein [Chloroflexota bacterium]
MARIAGLAFAGALLTAFAMVSISSAQESLEVTLDSLEGFEINGTATLNRTDAGYTEVIMVGNGLDPDGAPHINHIHDGTGCGNGEYGGVVITLPPLADTDPVSDGIMVGVNVVTETDAGEPISFEEIADGTHVVILHAVDGTPAACGAVPALAGGDMEADEMSADDMGADDLGVSPEAAPSTGSGGFLDQGGGASVTMLLAAALAMLGVGAVGATFAIRRVS